MGGHRKDLGERLDLPQLRENCDLELKFRRPLEVQDRQIREVKSCSKAGGCR